MTVHIAHTTGRRKRAVARVRVRIGTGTITVNSRSIEDFFPSDTHRMIITEPLRNTKTETAYDIDATIHGGGSSGQAGALRHGISKALSLYDVSLRPALKKVGFITRDSRVVERKKSGLAKARRSYQFSKR